MPNYAEVDMVELLRNLKYALDTEAMHMNSLLDIVVAIHH
jgi:hypothetical protein